jgi:lysine 6-dehydrogenase
MNYLVIGSGMMGQALAFDLARSSGVDRVTLADANMELATATASQIGSSKVAPLQLDINVPGTAVDAMRNHSVAIGATSYRHNMSLAAAAIQAGIHFCDLGGNDDVVEHELSLNEKAKEKKVTIIPNCGLAPGLANILGARGADKFDSVDSMKMRVGGLPKYPVPPLNYQIVFSVEGLLNEYSGKSKVLRNHRLSLVDTMTEIETIDFPPPFGALEAFHTSGGASLTPKTFEGKVCDLDYKTIRYPGHCEKFKALLDAGFGANEPLSLGANLLTEREMFIELLKRKLPHTGPDVVLMRVAVSGRKHGVHHVLTFTMIDFYDETNNIGAMMRGTAYPTSIIAQFLGNGVIHDPGVFTPEQCVPLEPLLAELQQRGLTITQDWT